MTVPLVKWAGGKREIAGLIAAILPPPTRYFEPFAGALGAFLTRDRASVEILSDSLAPLVELHVVTRDAPDRLIAALRTMPTSNPDDVYYAERDRFNAREGDSVERAARFIWLNRAGFNGLYRTNASGEMNAPVGTYRDRVSVPAPDTVLAAAKRLRGVKIVCADYRNVLDRVGAAGDVVYCDPPYVPASETASFTGYTGTGFSWAEQVDLRDRCEAAAARGAVVGVSNHDLPLTRRLYAPERGWQIHEIAVTGTMSAKAETRGTRHEILAVIGGGG